MSINDTYLVVGSPCRVLRLDGDICRLTQSENLEGFIVFRSVSLTAEALRCYQLPLVEPVFYCPMRPRYSAALFVIVGDAL